MMFSMPARLAVAAAALLASPVIAQTYTTCNPTTSTCNPDTALGMAINVDFSQGAVNSFTSSGGTPTYSSNGVSFTVAKSGDSPQLNSVFYIMFGRVEITMKAAPGTGIVSSVVLQSDDLDEIDFEWLGADPSNVQTIFFGKGQTSLAGRGQINPAASSTTQFITYVIDWTADRIVWSVGGNVVRTLKYADASGQYPQTPMQVKLGAWSGGDSSNAAGTVAWAGGSTNYAAGPYSMVVKNLKVTDYSTGSKYTYGDTSGTWQSIKSTGGKINANVGAASAVTQSLQATSSSSVSSSSVSSASTTATSSLSTTTTQGTTALAATTTTATPSASFTTMTTATSRLSTGFSNSTATATSSSATTTASAPVTVSGSNSLQPAVGLTMGLIMTLAIMTVGLL